MWRPGLGAPQRTSVPARFRLRRLRRHLGEEVVLLTNSRIDFATAERFFRSTMISSSTATARTVRQRSRFSVEGTAEDAPTDADQSPSQHAKPDE